MPGLSALGPVDYAAAEPPRGYKCSQCGVHGPKLWRRYQVFLDQNDLFCVTCAGADQKQDVDSVNERGYIKDGCAGRTCCIGWLVPAIPTEEGNTYWGYTSVPMAGVKWWEQLPSQAPTGGCQCNSQPE